MQTGKTLNKMVYLFTTDNLSGVKSAALTYAYCKKNNFSVTASYFHDDASADSIIHDLELTYSSLYVSRILGYDYPDSCIVMIDSNLIKNYSVRKKINEIRGKIAKAFEGDNANNPPVIFEFHGEYHLASLAMSLGMDPPSSMPTTDDCAHAISTLLAA